MKMTMRKHLTLLSILAIAALGCSPGGAGGGGGFQVTGRVLAVNTGGPPNPQATVQIGNASTTTGASDGLFVLNVDTGASAMTVLHSVFPTFVFTFPPVTADTDLGDFWIGPQTVTVTGSVLDASTLGAVDSATVTFGGRRAVTNASGAFTLTEVAYDPASEFIFFGIVGRVMKSGYIPAEFFVNQSPIGGVVSLPPILIAPVSDPNPPGPPYNLWGIVTLSGGGDPTGTEVTLKQNGTPVRFQNLGSDGRYRFWAVPGSYTILFQKSGFQDLEITITGFTSPDQLIRNDVTLIP